MCFPLPPQRSDNVCFSETHLTVYDTNTYWIIYGENNSHYKSYFTNHQMLAELSSLGVGCTLAALSVYTLMDLLNDLGL